MSQSTIVIIGGGAAGFFTAINCASLLPNSQVIILEKTSQLLAKVKISGGGRCNVTNACADLKTLLSFYPRGHKNLRSIFKQFGTKDTVEWFESRGVPLKAEPDGRVFPVSDNSQSIIDCLMKEAKRYGVQIHLRTQVTEVKKLTDGKFQLTLQSAGREGTESISCDSLVMAMGGHPQASHYKLAEHLGHTIVPPVPSLFTFNVPENPLSDLQGVSSEACKVRLTGTPQEQTGATLITHWGFSGPSVLKLSAWAARELHQLNYNFDFQIHWLPQYNEDQIREQLQQRRTTTPIRLVAANPLEGISARLWKTFCTQADVPEQTKWADLSKKSLNKLTDLLCRSTYSAQGKTTFKEEFVTAGGISSEEIDWQTMESKPCENLYFAGEMLDIDGVTGGFNFQAAWASAFAAAQSISKKAATLH